MKNYYAEIDKVLTEYENHKPYHTRDINWACDRIAWCFHWQKITKEQVDELTDRAIAIFDNKRR